MSKHTHDLPFLQKALKEAVAAYLTVTGMDCYRCALQVRRSLSRLNGVIFTIVSLSAGVATVAYDPTRTFPERLVQAVQRSVRDGRHHFEATVTRVGPAAELLPTASQDRRR